MITTDKLNLLNLSFEEALVREKEILDKYNIAPNQVYKDLDKRETGRFVKVLSVVSRDKKAECVVSCGGNTTAKSLWINFDRLANKKLYELV